jgi:hypothetical protein
MSYIYTGPYLLVLSSPTQSRVRTERKCTKEDCGKKSESLFCPACGSKVVTFTQEVKVHPSLLELDSSEQVMDLSLNRNRPKGPREGTEYLHLIANQHSFKYSVTYDLEKGVGLFEVVTPSEVEKAEAMVAFDRYTEQGGLRKRLEDAFDSVETRWGIFHYTFD